MVAEAFDLAETYVHLGVGPTVTPLPDFSWNRDYLLAYLRRFASDRDGGRLVGVTAATKTWDHWECHRAGDEVVFQLSGCSDVIQEIGGEHHRIRLTAGQAVINPKGVWHTSDIHTPGQTLFIAAGRRTEYRPR